MARSVRYHPSFDHDVVAAYDLIQSFSYTGPERPDWLREFMKLHIRDMICLMVLFAMAFAWWIDSSRLKRTAYRLESANLGLESRILSAEQREDLTISEADVLYEEVRRLRGIVKSSLADQSRWFELETNGNKLIAIRHATAESNTLTLDMIEKIEFETGLKAGRLRHFLTPISELQLGRD